MSILTDVKWFSAITGWAILVLWLPVTNHGRLEIIPALSFLSCCDAESGNPQDDDCQRDGCALVENGLYKIEKHHNEVDPPLFAHVALGPAMVEETRALCARWRGMAWRSSTPIVLATSRSGGCAIVADQILSTAILGELGIGVFGYLRGAVVSGVFWKYRS